MNAPTVIIRETAPVGIALDAANVRDLAHIRRLLVQSLLSVEGEIGSEEVHVPEAKLHLLRGYLTGIGAADTPSARRLLLMALLQWEDEDDARRFLVSRPALPVLMSSR